VKLRKTVDGEYTLKMKDEQGRETKEAHYKFKGLRDVGEYKKSK
jgi:hypothetical protein